jgi:hypothetical protein
VLFEPFIGILHRRYRDIFEKKTRKDRDGRATPWAQEKPFPRIEAASVEASSAFDYALLTTPDRRQGHRETLLL